MKTILGLDMGTNSVGWALIEQDFDNKQGEILGMGSRIIPMSQDVLDTFSGGKPLETQTAARTSYRSTRRLRERHLLRRERLHRILNILGFLPEHYANQIDFEKRLGQFFEETEPKLVYNDKKFIFKESFDEMLEDFKQSQPQLFYTKSDGKKAKIPYDWTIYYLRKKALTQKILKEELAWIILNFNQKRGYYQLRGEEDEDATRTAQTRIYFDTQIVVEIIDTGSVYKGLKIIQIKLENGDTGKYFSKEIPNWTGVQKNIIATVDLDKDGNDRLEDDGTLKRRFSIPTEEDWEKKWKLIKIKTEKEIKDSNKTVGTYIYNTLLQKPNQKIRGKLVRTIERKFYKDELIQILEKQIELQRELFTDDLYNNCVRELYRSNEAQQFALSKRDFVHLFVEDIIFYQRPLKSQKSSIGNCSLEYRIHKINKKDEKGNPIKNVFEKDDNGKDIEIKEYLKATPKSNPYYQEFRVWQWLSNLKIYNKSDDTDVTAQLIKSMDDQEKLFGFLMQQKEVNHKDVFKYILSPILKEQYPDAKPKAFEKELNKEIAKYRWNYVFDDSKEKEEDKSKKYPCNTTGYEIRGRLEKVEDLPSNFLTPEIEQHLWHIIYSVTDKEEYKSALGKFAKKYSLDEDSFIANFIKFPPFPSEYGAYSEKAIKKLLPIMRLGKYWNWDSIDAKTNERINKIITGEYDEDVKKRVREKAINLTENNHFQGLPLWLASYVVYGRHSEAENDIQWKTSQIIQEYLYDFRQHELRNPIVEQVVTETLRVVKDIWEYYAGKKSIPYTMVYDERKRKNVKSYDHFFDEIHIELGREMKNTAGDRQKITNQVLDNEDTNLRIKKMLLEFSKDKDFNNSQNQNIVRPYSPTQQDILKIFEDGVLSNYSEQELKNETTDLKNKEGKEITIYDISKKSQPTDKEIEKYKLWLEQKYCSPYTGQIIPLSKLFTTDYEIEHIIPKSRYYDDSFTNKVICESVVNKNPYKDNQLGLEFIKNQGGSIVTELSNKNKIVKIFTEEEYRNFIKDHYKNLPKGKRLLLEEIPEKMIARQMNDTRYISKFISALLSNIVRDEKDDDGINSKNLIPGNGKITTALKQDWGLNDVWNDLILPRFKRMNELTQTTNFTAVNQEGHIIPAIPLELSKGFQKKRIDHRHHAMDALVIACMTRDHVNLLNNQSAKSEISRYDLQNKLRNKEKESWFDKKENKQIERVVFKEFKKPWDNFTVDAKDRLETIVVSFKQNLRIINKATNYYEKIKDGKKIKVEQKGINWAIRKPMHKDTVSGKVTLTWVKVPKGKILTATRKIVDPSFDLKTIESITDTGIQKILKNYLLAKANNAELAFSSEGIEDLNKNISFYNDGKPHKPISKVRTFELGSKFPMGETGNKKDKYVEAAKGTNLYFVISHDEDGRRSYDTIPLNIVIERLKQGLKPVELKKENDFFLCPNDLVYVPTEDEKENIKEINFGKINIEQRNRIYKMVSSSSYQCFFIRQDVATSIVNKSEFSTLNKMEKSIDGDMIKEFCVKLKIDRIGNVKLYK